jgi:hypothetical protein
MVVTGGSRVLAVCEKGGRGNGLGDAITRVPAAAPPPSPGAGLDFLTPGGILETDGGRG